MLGLSFIHVGMLAATAAVTAPILIHLLFRQRVRNVAIGSVRFLQHVVREHRRRRRVRQWLLLALRSLAVLLLVLLFARPYWNELSRDGMDEEVVVLLDRSASMQARHDEQGPSAYERALEEVRRETTRLGENASIHFAWCDASGVEESPFDQFLARKEPGWLATDYGLAFGWASDVLAQSTRSSKRIVFCTDLQRIGLEKSAIPPLGAATTLDVRDLGTVIARDVAVLQADAMQTEIRPGDPIRLRAAVRNGGAMGIRDVQVKVALQGPLGKLESAKTLELPAGGTATVDLPLEVTTPGIYTGTVSINVPDALAWNNQRFVAFEARPPDRALLVDGQEGSSSFGNETYYLETALRLRSKDPAERVGAFEVERIVWEAGDGFPDLTGFRALILANLGRLTERDVTRLAEYVRGGGSVIWFSGSQTTRRMLDMLAEAGLIPPPASQEPVAGRFRVTKWKADHAALKVFDDPQRGDLRRLAMQKVWPLTPGPADQTLFSVDDPAVLVERAVGPGRFLYAGWSADGDWSDWTRSRLFVPLTRQLTAYATGALGMRQQVVQEIVSRREQKPGVERQGGRVIVRNVDAAEGVLDRITNEELASASGTHADNPAEREEIEQAALASAVGAQRPGEVWRAILWMLFGILAVELLLSSRIHN
jgi:hypothetical protein